MNIRTSLYFFSLMDIRCGALEIRWETRELEKFISVCVWGDPSLILSCVYFLQTCWDSWWGRTWRNVFAWVLDEPPGRKLILKEEMFSIWFSKRDLGYWPFRGEKETLGQFMLSLGLPPPPRVSFSWSAESRRLGWRVKIECFLKLCKTYLQNRIVMESLPQRYSSHFCVEHSGLSWTEDPRGHPLETSGCQHQPKIGPSRAQREEVVLQREVITVLNGNQRRQRAHRRTPQMGRSRREVGDK